MIINEVISTPITSVTPGEYFIDDDDIYELIDTHNEGNHYVYKVRDLMTNKVLELRYDSNDMVTRSSESDIKDYRVKHFEKITGINLVKLSTGEYSAVGSTQSKVRSAVSNYNRKYNTDIYYLGLDSNDGSIRLIIN